MISVSATSLRRIVQSRGSSAVELAIVLPLMLAMFAGCVDFARFAYTDIALANAVRAGAAWAMMNQPTNTTPTSSTWTPPTAWQTSLQTAVSNEMSLQTGYQSGSLTVGTVYPTAEVNGAITTWRFTVSATYPFQTILNWGGYGIPYSVTMSQSVTMRGVR